MIIYKATNRIMSKIFKETGQGKWNKGKKYSEERKRNISNATKGRIVSDETREKLSKIRRGRTPWNKGLTKETDPRVMKYCIKRVRKK